MLLQQLHWFPIEYRINVNTANVTFNILSYSQPAYIHSLLCFHTSASSLSSSNTNLLTVPFARTSLGARSFSVTSPKVWNSLPPVLHSCNCPDTFRRHLKTHYFQQAFLSSCIPPFLRLKDSAFADIVCVYNCHLLTSGQCQVYVKLCGLLWSVIALCVLWQQCRVTLVDRWPGVMTTRASLSLHLCLPTIYGCVAVFWLHTVSCQTSEEWQ